MKLKGGRGGRRAKLPNWPGSPTFWSQPVGWTYAWPYWRFQYAPAARNLLSLPCCSLGGLVVVPVCV